MMTGPISDVRITVPRVFLSEVETANGPENTENQEILDSV